METEKMNNTEQKEKRLLNRKVSWGVCISLVALCCAVTFGATWIASESTFTPLMTKSKRDALFSNIQEIGALVEKNYIGTTDEQDIIDYVSAGYTQGIGDPYSTYISPEAMAEYSLGKQGVLVGIGVAITQDESGYIKITEIYPNSPASEGGLEKGNLIISIDGKDVKEVGYANASTLIRGVKGTRIKLGIRSDGIDTTMEFQRREVDLPSVSYQMLDDKAYIKISQFNGNTPEQFKAALDDAQTKKAKGVIFDLRGNPGGGLTDVTDMLKMLLPAGPIAYKQEKDQTEKEVIDECTGQNELRLPMVVLTDKHTASAAELFTAALKDYNKAKSVGTTTYGKGVMQTLYKLKNGGAINITTAKYFPPKSDNYDGIGVAPDFEVVFTDEMAKKFELGTLTLEEDTMVKKALEIITATQTQ